MGISESKIAAKVKAFHDEAITRDPGLCTFSKDARFCSRFRVEDSADYYAACFCIEHQGQKRFALIHFKGDKRAERYASIMRMRGHNANIWQGRFVVVGPTRIPTQKIFIDQFRVGLEDMIEMHMYEDTLMLAIKRYKLNLDHIIGRVRQ